MEQQPKKDGWEGEAFKCKLFASTTFIECMMNIGHLISCINKEKKIKNKKEESWTGTERDKQMDVEIVEECCNAPCNALSLANCLLPVDWCGCFINTSGALKPGVPAL